MIDSAIDHCTELLTTHPLENNMTYYEHLERSLGFSLEFFIGSFRALIHGVFPFLYENSTTALVNGLNAVLES